MNLWISNYFIILTGLLHFHAWLWMYIQLLFLFFYLSIKIILILIGLPHFQTGPRTCLICNKWLEFVDVRLLCEFHRAPTFSCRAIRVFSTVINGLSWLTPHLYSDRWGNVLVQDWRDGTEADLTPLSPHHLILTHQPIGEGDVNGG